MPLVLSVEWQDTPLLLLTRMAREWTALGDPVEWEWELDILHEDSIGDGTECPCGLWGVVAELT